MKPTFFPTPDDFRKWLEQNHETSTEFLVGFYKVNSGKPSITWPESVNQALCFGWIDGVRKSIDEESYCIRFTPRKPTSIWSGINIKKVEELSKQGLMQPAGLAAFKKRTEAKSRVYSFEKDPVNLSAEFEKKFKANSKAWDFFQSQAPWYKKNAIHWVMDAKQEVTKLKRLETLITKSAAGERR
ncbi:bacteriocin-protection protein [Solitalea longa]|uniref:Bacteriocin-protection protein n=1 Tax=Solitalea longa TaxID=2079460 RepID=A0A2S5A4M1_9SPHI|nr:YdeI/OmpD-associated family protein [Solitalea longa]POY37541.1 bacteriocin-protection protein [Solitalea longa]